MRRGDVVAVADHATDFAGKPRPAVVVRSDVYSGLDAVTVCPMTSVGTEDHVLRLRIEPGAALPSAVPSWIMVEKITTLRADRIGTRIGRLSDEDIVRLTRSLATYLALA